MSERDRSRSPSRSRAEADEGINVDVVLPAVIERDPLEDSPDPELPEEDEVEELPDVAIESLLGGTPEQFDVSFAAIIKQQSGPSHDCGALHRC